MTNDKVKKRKVFKSKEARNSRSFDFALILLTYLLITGVILGKDGFMSGQEILIGSFLPAYLFWFVTSLLPQKSRFHESIIYQESLQELMKELYIHGFELREKVGDMYVFVRGSICTKERIFAKEIGGNCELYGKYPRSFVNRNATKE
jgi:hypothetical protein